MISALHLANFKAFSAPPARMPIRPITLVFGPNSGGKSSLIHGLVLGHDALFRKRFDIKRTKLGGNSIDLGGFRQYVHRRALDRLVTWGAEIEVPEGQENLLGVTRFVVLASFGLQLPDKRQQRAKPVLHTYEVKIGDERLLKMTRRGHGRLQLDEITPLFSSYLSKLREFLEPQNIDASTYQATLEEFTFPADGLSPRLIRETNIASDVEPTVATDKELISALLLGSEALYQYLADALNKLSYLGPLRSLPPRHLAFTTGDPIHGSAGGGRAWDRMRTSKALRDAVNAWLGNEDRLQTRYRLERRQFIAPETARHDIAAGLEKIRKKLFEAEAVEGDEGDEGEDEKELPEFVHRERWDRDEFNALMTAALLRNRRGDGDADLVLIDKNTNTEVSHRDVGIGISQVLPVLVEAYGNVGRLVAIEQPEIHLHPRLQAEIADVFLESALGARKNRFVLETHSEHIILRLMRRIRETTEERLPPGMVKVRPEDVAVLYVAPDSSGAKILEIPLTKDGELGAPWPGGFFPERMRELF